MSESNVEIVERLYAELEQGNFWVPEFFDPDVHIEWLEGVGITPETDGLAAMAELMKDWLEAYDDVTLIPERIIEAEDRIVVIGIWRGRGKSSGVTTEWRHGAVLTLRDGRVTSLISYNDPDDALEATGLSE